MHIRKGWNMKLIRFGTSMFAVALLASATLLAAPHAVLAAPDTNNGNDAEIDATLAPTANDRLFETSRQLEAAGVLGARSELAAIIADSRIADDGTWELLYFAGHARATTVLKLIDKVNAAAPLEVRAIPVDTDPVTLHKLAERISLGSESDLELLGVPSISGVRVDAERGVLIINVPSDATAQAGDPVIEGVPVEFDSNVNVQTQSRDWDWAPWTGGVALRNSATLGEADCTAGFNWSRWADGEKMGSTAEHCYNTTTQSWRYNHGNPVGQRYYYNSSRDVFLMRSYQGANKFAPNVFVGETTTNTTRTVVGSMASPPVNGAVALSGARSGLHTGKILYNGYYYNGIGPITVTDGTFCRRGDSGGPWLATNSAGNVIAYGQHHGGFTNNAGTVVYNCLFIPVTPISATMQATIMTG